MTSLQIMMNIDGADNSDKDDALGSCLLATSMWKMSEMLTSPKMTIMLSADIPC